MKRLSMCILVLGLATASCTLPDVPEGECGTDVPLGHDACQCVASDDGYSNGSQRFTPGKEKELKECTDKQNEFYVTLEDKTSEIYVCIQHKCDKATCKEGTEPDDDNIKCIKQCASNETHEDDNTCICDTEKNWEGEAGACRCKLGYVEVSGACVASLENTCDLIKELYDARTNTCKCDVSKRFEGEAGSCTCKTGYVLINGACEEKQTCRKDQVYIEADNTCICPPDYEEQDGACVHTKECSGDNQVYDIDKDACVCVEGYLWFGDACIAKAECTGSSKRMISHSDVGTCTCFIGYTYIYNDCYQAGETLTFGRYPQDEDSDAPSSLKWRILEINDDAALLISEYVLEQYRYHDTREDITWEKSNVRSYLNGLSAAFNKNGIDHDGNGFIDKAFTADERKWIKQVMNKNPDASADWNSTPGGSDTEDKVFLLSRDEALKHFKTNKSRIASPTAYALHPPTNSGSINLYTCPVTCSSDNSCAGTEGSTWNNDASNVQLCSNIQCASYWWLRSAGKSPNTVAIVNYGGGVSSLYVSHDYIGLRPALYVYLRSER